MWRPFASGCGASPQIDTRCLFGDQYPRASKNRPSNHIAAPSILPGADDLREELRSHEHALSGQRPNRLHREDRDDLDLPHAALPPYRDGERVVLLREAYDREPSIHVSVQHHAVGAP